MPAYPLSAVIVGSILSSVSLIATVKQTFNHGFPFVFTLSTLHFFVTFVLLNVSHGLNEPTPTRMTSSYARTKPASGQTCVFARLTNIG
jgi:hypothetical protein